MTDTGEDAKQVAIRSMQIMAAGELADFEAVIHPEATNREDTAEPPATRGKGPAAFHASAEWLRSAYADLHWEVHEATAEGDLVALHVTMSGRQTGTFVVYGPDAQPAQAFPSTGKTFAVTQTHWIRVRDDLGQATQLGWVPPNPIYLLRMRRALSEARKAAH
ncbi:ester cyclase [Nocardia tengchongensis]|uniref:ester cyclase n=1 Tax=Nocardia tengchongensis TaxID=2055889 RepID=UPI0036680D71